jgi:hypothetical protein
MPLGEFVIGRSSQCNLALDDALVSRRHALIRVQDHGVSVEDLGSRNGILVNGERVDGQRTLQHLDRIAIGSQEMVVLEQGRGDAERATRESALCSQCSSPVQPGQNACPHCGAAVANPRQRAQTLEAQLPPVEAETDEPTTTGFAMIATIAGKALGMGRYEEAERLLRQHLDVVMERARNDNPLPHDQIEEGTRLALRLAEGLKRPQWLDWTFQLYEAIGELMSAETIDRLHEVVRNTRYDNPRALRSYMQSLRDAHPDGFTPTQRFLMRRLESLERVISA